MSKFPATIRTDDKTRALQSAMLSVLEEKTSFRLRQIILACIYCMANFQVVT